MNDADALKAVHAAILAWMQDPSSSDRQLILRLIETVEDSGRPFIEGVRFGDGPEVQWGKP